MSSSAGAAERRREKPIPLLLGGYAALAETAWMGVAQATDVLEPVRVAAGRWLRARRPARLVSHEFTIIQATALLMGSFFFSALLGAVRQVLFNAQFGAGSEATAVLNGRNQFLLTGLSVASHNVCLIAGILSGKPPERRRGRMHSSGDLPGRCSQSTGLHCPHRRPRGAGRGTTSASLRSARVWRDVSPLHGPDR